MPGVRRALQDERGMTMAEILAAAAVIGIGLTALAAAIPLASYGIQEGNQLSTATFLANQRLEQVRNARWEGGAAAVDTVGVSPSDTAAPVAGGVTTFPDETPMAAPYASYNRRVRVTDCGAGLGCGGIVNAELRQVVVTVDYRPLTGVGVAAATQRKGAVVSLYLSRR
jgi:prepilin-type N-terminal cleavage/methylation domain-containing protein